MRANKAPGVNHGPEWNLADAKRQAVLGMRMNHSIDVRARRVDAGVNESFNRRLPAVGNCLSVQSEFDEIAVLYDFGRRQHMSHEEPLRIFRITYADVAVGIHDIFLGEDPVGNDKFVESFFQSDHHRSPGALYRKDLL